MSASRYIVVTATDDTYIEPARDLIASLRKLVLPFTIDIGVLDLGLSEDSKKLLAPFDAIFKTPKADIDYPDRENWEQQAPYYRAMTSRPYLRDYFPGYVSYMWMDGDTWAQTADAVATMLPAAETDDALYIASEIDRDYLPYFQTSQPWEFHFKWYQTHFGNDVVSKFFPRPMLNTGVMAMSPKSQVWGKWAETFASCLKRIPKMGRENFMSEQLSLNVALHLNSLPYKVMPAEFNWLSLYALPVIDATTGLYVRPTVPRSPISVIHITHQGKLRELDLATTDGKMVKRKLTYADYARN